MLGVPKFLTWRKEIENKLMISRVGGRAGKNSTHVWVDGREGGSGSIIDTILKATIGSTKRVRKSLIAD